MVISYNILVIVTLLATKTIVVFPTSNGLESNGNSKRVKEETNNSLSWTIERASDPRISFGQEQQDAKNTISISIEVDFYIPSEELAAIAQVSVFPFGQCGVGDAILNGSGSFCSSAADDDKCKLPTKDDKKLLFTAKYMIDDVEAPAGSTIWDTETKNVTFCGRVSLSQGDTVVSFYDMEFDYHIDLDADFTISNLQQPPSPLHTELFSQSFSYELDGCLCSSSNSCITNIPAIQMGQNVRICINTPSTGEKIEIVEFKEWTLEQANTGVSRYAVHEGKPDGLTVIDTMTGNQIIAYTPLNAAFFKDPKYNSVSLWGLVSVMPITAIPDSRHRFTQGRGMSPIKEEGTENAFFRLDFQLVDDDKAGSSQQTVDAIIVLISLALLALAIFIVRRQRNNNKKVRNDCTDPQSILYC
ncbi:hypothetical protein IV203_025226 [Nitzschia inconspicua]|uniref:Uncharacterized protein n=1 Tax=Nitzschia inconspicua TaxID=303405 RepID=A0A9K3LHT2_9STRA|nr:hypothetical protein IV203_024764 [Nitzschia inconspicua]KAG7362342.1 hypothetical protein IV203_025226 [Nitzschia inconspicua]